MAQSPLVPEPTIVLPTIGILAANLVVGAVVAGGAWAVGAVLDRPLWGSAGLWAAGITTAAACVGAVAGLPWIPKPASTAMLAWMAASLLRALLTLAGAFLLYSAPPQGWPEGLAAAKAPFLLLVAFAFLVGLLAEVAVIARRMNRPYPVRGPA